MQFAINRIHGNENKIIVLTDDEVRAVYTAFKATLEVSPKAETDGRYLKSSEVDRIKSTILKHDRAFGGNVTQKVLIHELGIGSKTYQKYKQQLLASVGIGA